MYRRCGVVVAVVPILIAVGEAPAATLGADLAAHRAVYQLSLENSRGNEVSAATGSMAYEVLDACDGWAVRQRLRMVITNHDGQDIEMVSDYTTWESKDGLKLRFRMRQTTDQAVTSEVAGDAELQGQGKPGSAHYTLPEDATKALPAGTLFPMAHTTALLSAARDSRKFAALPLFDGTSTQGAQDSSVVVLKWPDTDTTKWTDLSKLSSGRFHIAFFDRDTNSQQPDYEIAMRYWVNGVADELAMDFGNFVMDGKMSEFALLPHGC